MASRLVASLDCLAELLFGAVAGLRAEIEKATPRRGYLEARVSHDGNQFVATARRLRLGVDESLAESPYYDWLRAAVARYDPRQVIPVVIYNGALEQTVIFPLPWLESENCAEYCENCGSTGLCAGCE